MTMMKKLVIMMMKLLRMITGNKTNTQKMMMLRTIWTLF